MIALLRMLRPGRAGGAYVVAVAATAALGFGSGSTALILVAAALALPASGLALPAYYLGYGLLALVPGADPSWAYGSAQCTAAGSCARASAGGPATWFTITAAVLGVLLLALAALANVLVARWALRARRRVA